MHMHVCCMLCNVQRTSSVQFVLFSYNRKDIVRRYRWITDGVKQKHPATNFTLTLVRIERAKFFILLNDSNPNHYGKLRLSTMHYCRRSNVELANSQTNFVFSKRLLKIHGSWALKQIFE